MPIHPDLRRRDAIDRYIGVPLIVAVSAWLLTIVAILYREAEGRLTGPTIAILIVGTIVALLVLSTAIMAWRRRRWYEALTALQERKPVPMRVTFSPGPPRALHATLEPADEATPAFDALLVAPRFDVAALNGTEIEAHIDPKPDGPVVLTTPLGILWPIAGRDERPMPPDLRRAAKLLREAGLTSEADDLENVLSTAFTTGSEWRGEIGLAMERIRRRGVALPEEVERIFRAASQ